MEQGPSWEVNKFSASQGSTYFMESEGSLSHSQQSVAPHHSEPDQSSPCPSSNILKFHLNLILPSKHGSSKWSLSLRFRHQNPAYTSQTLQTLLLSPVSVTCPAHLILLDLITRIFGEEYRLLSSSLCSLLHSLVSSSFLGPNILSTPFSNTLVPASTWVIKFHTYIQQQAKLQFCIS